MKRVVLLICLSLIFLSHGIIAPSQEYNNSSGSVVSISLSLEDGELSWEAEGYSQYGFKVVWSKNANPEYPLREGDKYHYYSDPEADEDTLEAFDGEGTYYVRVCEYLGGKCGVYSNELQVYLGENATKLESQEKEETKEQTQEKEEEQEMEQEHYGNGSICEGCSSNETCYPLGYRKDGKYCSEYKQFQNQSLEEESCENNFECESNVCVDNSCVSGSLLRKIAAWFKRLFS